MAMVIYRFILLGTKLGMRLLPKVGLISGTDRDSALRHPPIDPWGMCQ